MEIKLFEIRDLGVFIPAMAVRLSGRTAAEKSLLERAGYDKNKVLLQAFNNCFSPRQTMLYAHKYIQENWNYLKTGDEIDIEYIHGKTERPN